MTLRNSIRTACLSAALAFVLIIAACADLRPLQDHVAELETNQARTAALVEKLIKRLAAALAQTEEAQKELARMLAAEGGVR